MRGTFLPAAGGPDRSVVAVPGSLCSPTKSNTFPWLLFRFEMQLRSLLVCGKALNMFVELSENGGKWIGPFSWAVNLRVRCRGEGGIDGYKEAGGRSKVGKISVRVYRWLYSHC